MTEQDRFDGELARRLAAAESRVQAPSSPRMLATAPGNRWLRAGLLTAAAGAAAVVALAIVGRLPQPITGESTPTPDSGVSAEARSGDFVLTLSSPRSTWTTAEAIEVTATLSYEGDQPQVEIGGGGGPVVFGLRQLTGGNALFEGGQDLPCLSFSLGPDAPLVWPFQKAGGVQSEPPFDQAFFDEPALYLPSGRWAVDAHLVYGVGDCGALQLDVSIELDVVDESPGPSPAKTQTDAASPSPTPAATPDESPARSWTTAGSFQGEGGPAMVQGITSLGDRLVAIGIAYQAPLPNVGPTPPHRAMIWLSDDGRTWEQVGLGDQFANVDLQHVITRADGSVLALGHRMTGDQDLVTDHVPVAWTSVDGRSWVEAASGLKDTPRDVVAGEKGYLALLSAAQFGVPDEVWFSADGARWEPSREVEANRISIAAGDDGFVITGVAGADDSQPFALASGDGRTWFQGATPPSGPISLLASRGGDWIAVTAFGPTGANGDAWFSTNGLDWTARGRVELHTVTLDDGASCFEYPRTLSSAGDLLILSTELSGPCSEGGFAVYGNVYASIDGLAWADLGFAPGTPGQSRSGSWVAAGATLNGRPILGGERDGAATFWIGEQR